MRRNLYVLWALLLLTALLAAACSPGAATAPQQTQEAAQPTSAAGEPEPTAVGAEPEATQPPAAAPGVEGAREDIPIMEAARDLQVLRGGGTITYEVDTDIETVVNFYTEELPKHGWELAGPQDSILASLAAMLRENQDGDRMTINMQANQLGGFVRINISVVRAN